MASVVRRRGSKIWSVMLLDCHGRQHCLSTRQTDEGIALILARQWEAAAKQKRTRVQNYKVIAHLHELVGGEPLAPQLVVPETPQSIRGEKEKLSISERRKKRLELLRDELENRRLLNGKLNRRFWEIVRGIGCTCCDFNKWLQILQFHHIDGNSKNHSLENLTVLCPNCHLGLHHGIAEIEFKSLAQLLFEQDFAGTATGPSSAAN